MKPLWIKVVPLATPNADGDWRKVELNDSMFEAVRVARSFHFSAAALSRFITREEVIVAISMKDPNAN